MEYRYNCLFAFDWFSSIWWWRIREGNNKVNLNIIINLIFILLKNIRQTIYDSISFNEIIWKKISLEAKSFIERLLDKNSESRIPIKELLEHPWLLKYQKNSLRELRKKLRTSNESIFKIYSTCDENSNSKDDKW